MATASTLEPALRSLVDQWMMSYSLASIASTKVHICSATCQWLISGDLFCCIQSGYVHQCGLRYCNHKTSASYGMECDLTRRNLSISEEVSTTAKPYTPNNGCIDPTSMEVDTENGSSTISSMYTSSFSSTQSSLKRVPDLFYVYLNARSSCSSSSSAATRITSSPKSAFHRPSTTHSTNSAKPVQLKVQPVTQSIVSVCIQTDEATKLTKHAPRKRELLLLDQQIRVTPSPSSSSFSQQQPSPVLPSPLAFRRTASFSFVTDERL